MKETAAEPAPPFLPRLRHNSECETSWTLVIRLYYYKTYRYGCVLSLRSFITDTTCSVIVKTLTHPFHQRGDVPSFLKNCAEKLNKTLPNKATRVVVVVWFTTWGLVVESSHLHGVRRVRQKGVFHST